MPQDIAQLRDQFCPIIERRLRQPMYLNRIISGIGSFIDRNSYILYTFNMSDRYSFSDDDRAIIYDAIGITEQQVKRSIDRSVDIYSANKVISNPFYVTCVLVIHVLLKLKMREKALLVATYMSMMMYVSAHSGRWPSRPNKNIMDYTLAHLDRGFRITQVKSIYELIYDNAETVLNTYEKWIYTPPGEALPQTERREEKYSSKKVLVTIDPCSDLEIKNVVDQFWTRMKQKLTNIAKEFYKNQKSGRYLNYDSDSYSEDNYRVMDNDSFALDRLSGVVYGKLINHQFKAQWLKMAITQSSVSYQKLVNLFDDIIQEDEDERLRNFILAVLEYFTMVTGNTIAQIGTPKFISVIVAGYSSAANSEQMKLIKDTLDYWMKNHMVKYGRQNYGKTAGIAYKKSILMTLVYIINYEAKLI